MNQYPDGVRLLALLILLISLEPSGLAGNTLPRIVVSGDGERFVLQGTDQTFHAMGVNYDHDESGRLLEDYWHTEWDRVCEDFAQMKQLGVSVVRVHLQFGRFMESAEKARTSELEQLRKLLQLAEDTGLYLDLTGLGCYHKADVPEWYDQLDETSRWKAQEVFWECVAAVCKDTSAVFCFNLMNEPVIGGDTPGTDWLGPAFGGKHFVQFVARGTGGRLRHEIAKEWIDRMAAAVRRKDTQHLITVGFVDWSLDRPGLTSGFVPQKVSDRLDFLSVHIYPESKQPNLARETLKGFQIGKPVVVEETFPLKCTADELEAFMDESGDQSDGWISFFWGRMPDEYSEKNSIGDAITAEWLRRFSRRMRQATPESGNPRTSESSVLQTVVNHIRSNPEGSVPFSLNLSAWTAENRHLPIGVFDSGIGGLTVLEALLTADEFHNTTLAPGQDGIPDFQNEQFVYFGDQANMPYGNYPAVNQTDYLKELILKDAIFLLGQRVYSSPQAAAPVMTKPPVKAIVIACNTATAFGMQEIQQAMQEWKIPVFVLGVVDAGARGVLEQTSPDQRRTIAVLATVGTCSSNAYPNAITRTLGRAGRPLPAVIQQGSRGLAGAIEGDPAFVTSFERLAERYSGPSANQGDAAIHPELREMYNFEPSGLIGSFDAPASLQLNSVSNYIRYDMVTLLEKHRASGQKTPIDSVVLGCTHFPLVRQEILTEFERLRNLEVEGVQPYHSLIASKIEVVDPATLLARDLFRALAQRKSFAERTPAGPAEPSRGPRDLFFISVPTATWPEVVLTADGALDRSYKYGRQSGRLDREDTRAVPLNLALLPDSSKSLIRTHLPVVAERLGIPKK